MAAENPDHPTASAPAAQQASATAPSVPILPNQIALRGIEKLPTEILQQISKLPGAIWLPYASPLLYDSLDTNSLRKSILNQAFRLDGIITPGKIADVKKGQKELASLLADSGPSARSDEYFTWRESRNKQQLAEIADGMLESEYLEFFSQAVQLPWFNKISFNPEPDPNGKPALIELKTIREWTKEKHAKKAMFGQEGSWTQALGDFICGVLSTFSGPESSILWHVEVKMTQQAIIRTLHEGCKPAIWILTGIELNGVWDIVGAQPAKQKRKEDQIVDGERSLSFLRGRRNWDTLNCNKAKFRKQHKWFQSVYKPPITDIIERAQLNNEPLENRKLWDEFITKYWHNYLRLDQVPLLPAERGGPRAVEWMADSLAALYVHERDETHLDVQVKKRMMEHYAAVLPGSGSSGNFKDDDMENYRRLEEARERIEEANSRFLGELGKIDLLAPSQPFVNRAGLSVLFAWKIADEAYERACTSYKDW